MINLDESKTNTVTFKEICFTCSQLIFFTDVICNQWHPALENTSSISCCSCDLLIAEDARQSSADWQASLSSLLTHHLSNEDAQHTNVKRQRTMNVVICMFRCLRQTCVQSNATNSSKSMYSMARLTRLRAFAAEPCSRPTCNGDSNNIASASGVTRPRRPRLPLGPRRCESNQGPVAAGPGISSHRC